jgi:hypothetical protein
MSQDVFALFKDRLDQLLQPYAGKLEYGNLRRQDSSWGEGDEKVTNVALVYETPGGSTDQINVTCHHGPGYFVLLDTNTHEETTLSDVEELMGRIEPQIQAIPERRLDRLRDDVNRWIAQGLNRMAISQELNKYHHSQTEFKGGSITPQELAAALKFAIIRLTRSRAEGA